MRKIIVLFIVMSLNLTAFAGVNAYVSILPQKYFLEQIGRDRVNIKVMVMPGASPATYEPKPKQMTEMSSADIYFAIDVPFEQTWLPKFAAINPEMKIVRTDDGIEKLHMAKHVHEGETEHRDGDESEIKDPHVWLDPILVMKQADNITAALCEEDPDGCAFYKGNRDRFSVKLTKLNIEIERILFLHKGDHFMVFHPSWGYFAERYGLEQIPVELEGKEPKPSDLKNFVELAKKLNLKTIFIQPQFAKRAAELIAGETGATVATIDPLAGDWENNLITAARAIAESQTKK